MATLIKKVPVYKCEVCDHEWQSETGEKPLRCAKCKTPYWDRAKKAAAKQ